MKSLDHIRIDSKNPLYLTFNNEDEYIIARSNGGKYLIFASTDKNKEVIKKYIKLWNKTKNQIKTINGGKPIEYKKDFLEIRFESYDDLPLGKILNILSLVIVTRSVFREDNKYYPQVYLYVCMSYKNAAI